MLTAMTRINISTVKPACFKMKSEVDSIICERKSVTPEDHLDVANLLERLGLADIDYDEVSEPEWCFPETKCTEMSSRHLSGGGLVTKTCETPTALLSGRITPATSQSSQSSEDFAAHATNPFRNNHMRLVLEADEVLQALEEEIGHNVEFSLNPFNRLNEQVNRTMSQCSTRAVSPTLANPFHRVCATMSQATQTGEEIDKELRNIQQSLKALELCGWYHKGVNWQDSIILLQGTQPGTFLVRDSADPDFIFSLSLQTVRGPTSVRLHHINGLFRLDSEAKLIPSIPSFESVIELVEYYVEKSEKKRRKSKCRKGKTTKEQVWVDVSGQVYSSIMLTKAMGVSGTVPQLKHLCRLQVNSMLRNANNKRDKLIPKSKRQGRIEHLLSRINEMNIPPSVQNFLKDYPYSI